MKKCILLIALLAIAGVASADLYTLISAPGNATSWNDAGLTWSNVTTGVVGTHAASAGNDYVVDSALVTSGKIRGTSSTFAGDSLTVRGSVNKVTLAPSSNSANIILDGGSILLAGTPVVLEGTLAGSGLIGLVRRDLTLNSLLSGSGTIEVNNANNATVQALFALGGSSSTFTGLLVVGGTGTDSDSRRVTLDMNYDNAVAFDMDLAETGGINAVLNIDQNIKLNSLTMGAAGDLADGTYTYAQLVTAGYGAYFTDGGSGSLTIGLVATSVKGTLFTIK